MAEPDYVIAGAGIAGLSLALELERRGAKVVVLERERALGQASTAAAGMLAVDDPNNPSEIHALAKLSVSLYPEFLDRIAQLSGMRVPFQTSATLQAIPPTSGLQALNNPTALVPQLIAGEERFALLDERSVDPRQMAAAVLEAVRRTSIDLREHTPLQRIAAMKDGVRVETAGATLHAGYLVDCMGAWTPGPVAPRKGQMLMVERPADLPLKMVVRTERIYIVPRTDGPNAGRAIIGATVENAGFDLEVRPLSILALNKLATQLLPQLGQAVFVESWAGLRPGTEDGLPVLGPTTRQPRYVMANGLFRNGILLAPGMARVMAQVLTGETPELSLEAFTPGRF